MTDVTISDITLRTTSDGEAFAHGLAIGAGASLDQAVTGLMDEARRQAEEITGERRPPRYFEVADVRLTHAPDGGDEKWVAYGTLRSTSGRPAPVATGTHAASTRQPGIPAASALGKGA